MPRKLLFGQILLHSLFLPAMLNNIVFLFADVESDQALLLKYLLNPDPNILIATYPNEMYLELPTPQMSDRIKEASAVRVALSAVRAKGIESIKGNC